MIFTGSQVYLLSVKKESLQNQWNQKQLHHFRFFSVTLIPLTDFKTASTDNCSSCLGKVGLISKCLTIFEITLFISNMANLWPVKITIIEENGVRNTHRYNFLNQRWTERRHTEKRCRNFGTFRVWIFPALEKTPNFCANRKWKKRCWCF